MPTAQPSKSAEPGRSGHDALAAEVLRQFRQVFNTVKTHFQQVEKKGGLGGAQVWALSVIQAQAGIRVTGLAQAMDIHQSTASNPVRGLIERELITSFKDDPDRRVVRLKLKPAGAKVLRAVPGPFTGVLPDALQSSGGQENERRCGKRRAPGARVAAGRPETDTGRRLAALERRLESPPSDRTGFRTSRP